MAEPGTESSRRKAARAWQSLSMRHPDHGGNKDASGGLRSGSASTAWRTARRPGGKGRRPRWYEVSRSEALVASTLIAAILNPKVIQARLGHATIKETMDTYGHLFPESEDLGRGP